MFLHCQGRHGSGRQGWTERVSRPRHALARRHRVSGCAEPSRGKDRGCRDQALRRKAKQKKLATREPHGLHSEGRREMIAEIQKVAVVLQTCCLFHSPSSLHSAFSPPCYRPDNHHLPTPTNVHDSPLFDDDSHDDQQQRETGAPAGFALRAGVTDRSASLMQIRRLARRPRRQNPLSL